MAGYLGASPVPQSILKKESKTLTANQTTVNTSGYTHGGSISVTLNGVLLEGAGVDYTATNGSDIVLTAGATAGDILHFQAFNEFTLVGQELTTPTINDATLKSNVTLKNDTHEDSDGGRASKIIYQGEQSGGEISTLAEIQASHDGSADDQKSDLIFRTNDGSDGTSPTEAMRIQSDQKIGVGLSSNISSQLHVNSEVSLGPDNNNRMIVGSTAAGVGSIGTIEAGTASFSTATFKGGNVGIGESDPKADLVVKQSGSTFTTNGNTVALFQRNTATGSGAMVSILSGNNSAADLNFADADDEDVGRIRYNHPDNSMQFQTGAAERMRLTQNHALFGMTTNDSQGVQLYTNGANGIWAKCTGTVNYWITNAGLGAGNGTIATIYSDTTSVGSITVTSSSTAYSTSSDYRLKENVTDVTDGITRVKQLAPKRFNFIADADTTVDGFLAHEAQTVVPEAITGTKDEVDDNGDAVMQNIDQSKLVPLLTAALQEAIAKIETLETKVAALEAE